MGGHRRQPVLTRGADTDLFDDPPWDPYDDDRRSGLAWLGHVALVLFLALLALMAVVAATSAVVFLKGFHFSLGPVGPITFPPPSTNAMDIALSPDGTLAYLTEPASDSLLVLSTATGQLRATVPVGNDPSGLALSPDGAQVWVVDTALSASTGTVSVVSTTTDELVGTVPVGPGPIDVAFSPDGRTAYVTDNGVLTPGSLTVIDTAALAVVATLTPTTSPTSAPPSTVLGAATPPPSSAGAAGVNPTSVAVTPDGREIWVSAVDDLQGSSTAPDRVYVFDAITGAERAAIPVGSGPFFMTLSHDGRDAYVADKLSCDVREIDTTTFRVLATVAWPKSAGCPFGLDAGPNDNIVDTVTGSDKTFDQAHAGHTFGSVNFATGRALVEGPVGSDPVTLTLSADGTTAYVVDADHPLLDLVDPLTGSIRSTFALPPGGLS